MKRIWNDSTRRDEKRTSHGGRGTGGRLRHRLIDTPSQLYRQDHPTSHPSQPPSQSLETRSRTVTHRGLTNTPVQTHKVTGRGSQRHGGKVTRGGFPAAVM